MIPLRLAEDRVDVGVQPAYEGVPLAGAEELNHFDAEIAERSCQSALDVRNPSDSGGARHRADQKHPQTAVSFHADDSTSSSR